MQYDSGERRPQSTGLLQQYNAVAAATARTVIGEYSTSFSLACRFLGGEARRDIECIYALVRVADEIVDGVAAAAGLGPGATAAALDQLEAEVEAALVSGYSTDLIVHAFAQAARTNGITEVLIRPFFASMRADLSPQRHTPESLAEYIYGSAEVVGLMCLEVFRRMRGTDDSDAEAMAQAACHLGAAFQKVNFLRDAAQDTDDLGRSYLPGVEGMLTTEQKDEFVADIRDDLAAAWVGIPCLDSRAGIAVEIALRLFEELTDLLDRSPAERIMTHRVRVSDARKAVIAAQVVSGRARRAARGGLRALRR